MGRSIIRLRIDGCVAEDERQLVIDLALGHSAVVRSQRLVHRLTGLAEGGRPMRRTLDQVRSSLRASMGIERMLAEKACTVALGACVERFATLRALASGKAMRLRTSIVEQESETALFRLIAFAVCELVQMFECFPVTPDIMLAISVDGDELVVGLAAEGLRDHPIPDRPGLACFERVGRMIGALGGGVDRGMRDALMIVGITLPISVIHADVA